MLFLAGSIFATLLALLGGQQLVKRLRRKDVRYLGAQEYYDSLKKGK